MTRLEPAVHEGRVSDTHLLHLQPLGPSMPAGSSCPFRVLVSYQGQPWVHSSVARAADCRSAGPWLKSGCALWRIASAGAQGKAFRRAAECVLSFARQRAPQPDAALECRLFSAAISCVRVVLGSEPRLGVPSTLASQVAASCLRARQQYHPNLSPG